MSSSIKISHHNSGNFSQNVAARFDNAACTYDKNSDVQRYVAKRLANNIASSSLPSNSSVLEIGCGTGHLTAELSLHLPEARIVATDISTSMLKACRTRLGYHERLSYIAMDGEKPSVSGKFDLICSSLALQWFPDLTTSLRTLANMLKPSGKLCVTLLGTKTFQEWRDAHRNHGVSAGSLSFLTLDACEKSFPVGHLQLCTEQYVDQPTSILEFLRSLRAIGADTPIVGHSPISPGKFRKILRELKFSPEMTYEIIYACWEAT